MTIQPDIAFVGLQAEAALLGAAAGPILDLGGRVRVECSPEHHARRQGVGLWRQPRSSSSAGLHFSGRLQLELWPVDSLELLLGSCMSILTRTEGEEQVTAYGLQQAGQLAVPGLRLMVSYAEGLHLLYRGVRVVEATVSCRSRQFARLAVQFLALAKDETVVDPAWAESAMSAVPDWCLPSAAAVSIGSTGEDLLDVSATVRHPATPAGLLATGLFSSYSSRPPLSIFGTAGVYHDTGSAVRGLVESGQPVPINIQLPSQSGRMVELDLGAVVFESGAPQPASATGDTWQAAWTNVGTGDVNPLVVTVPGTGSGSSSVEEEPLPPPTVPVLGVECIAGGFSRLSWNTQFNCSFVLEVSTDGGGSWSSLATPPALTFGYDHNVPDFYHDYRYRVAATNASGTSGWSNVVACPWSLALDIDARTISSVLHLGRITSVQDSSHHGRHAYQPVELRRPIFFQDHFGTGRHSMRFQNTMTYDAPIPTSIVNFSQFLELPSGWTTLDQGLTAMIVFNKPVTGGARTLLALGEKTGEDILISHGTDIGGQCVLRTGFSTIFDQGLADMSAASAVPALVTVRFDGTNFRYWLDAAVEGTLATSALPSSASRGSNFIGAAIYPWVGGNDFISHVKLWSRALTDSEVITEQYALFAAWGITP